MLLQWEEKDPFQGTVLRESYPVNVKNVQQYADRGKDEYGEPCKKCEGRGWLEWDNGYKYAIVNHPPIYMSQGYTIDVPPTIERVRYNIRKMTCSCVDRNLQKLEDAKKI